MMDRKAQIGRGRPGISRSWNARSQFASVSTGRALIVSNLAVEAVMVRLPVYDYYAAYGSAAPLQVTLDPVSHDPAGYSVLVDGAVAACSNQPPFHIDTSALDVGVHTVTVRCETFPDLESIAALVVVKMGIDRAEANLAWTVQSASLQLSWDPWGVPNDTVSWSVSPSGLSYTESSGDVFTFSPTNSTPGEYTVNWRPYFFGYDGSTSQYQEGTNRFYRGTISNPAEILSVENDCQRYRIFAYCAESRSRALGQVTSGVAGFGAWNLNTSMGYDKQHYAHSREFRSNTPAERLFWINIFSDCGFVTSLKGTEQ